jgi:2,3-bisphosphoglycerate-dependent phosphoglycerate mutase
VVRHGQSEGNVARQLSAAVPGGPLTDVGRQQAAEAAASLADRDVFAVYASPLLRAGQTAAIIADAVAVADVGTLADLREFDLGDCEGSDTDADWARVDAVYDGWLDGDLGRSLPGGECGADVVTRARRALRAVLARHPGRTVVLVSHGGIMSVALPRIADDAPDDRARGGGIPNCGVVELVGAEGDPARWSLRSWPAGGPAELGSRDPGERLGRAGGGPGLAGAPPGPTFGVGG